MLATMGYVVLVSGVARAQAPAPAAGTTARSKPQPLNLQHAQPGTQGLGATARARMTPGDYAGALDVFDEALRTSTEPTLYRDRGLCHEKLGHPYPAMDDYRRYLTNAPDAPDADSIRERLDLLQDQISGHVHSSESDDSPFATPAAAPPPPSDRSTEAQAKGPMGGQPSTRVETYDDADDDINGALRHGRGWSVAPFFAEHKWFLDGSSFGDSQTWAECVGLQIRYSIAPRGTLVLEAGYEHFNSTNVDVAVVYGLSSLFAYEFRIPMDVRYDNQFFVAPGVGYEQLVVAPTDPSASTTSEGAISGRVRFGWRHLLGSSTALELSLDGGVAEFFTFDGSGMSSTAGLAGLNLALAWAL